MVGDALDRERLPIKGDQEGLLSITSRGGEKRSIIEESKKETPGSRRRYRV